MQKQVQIQLPAADAQSDEHILQAIARTLGVTQEKITGYFLVKRSLDARPREPRMNLSVHVFIGEPVQARKLIRVEPRDVSRSPKRVAIVGAGPAGLFAALSLIEAGIKPVVLERGRDVRTRRRDLAALNKQGVVNPESNYCFGEGGAGTYSDGKLYTRSNKRGSVERVLNLFVQFGAAEQILCDAHPHIGTNKLPGIIAALRDFILACGGEMHFGKKLTGFRTSGARIESLETADGDLVRADACILATGHSARDVFELLQANGIAIEAKPFALGVRVEHPQELINRIRYRKAAAVLPPASYSLVENAGARSVFSFCMCPGGIIAPAATAPGEIVVNGWSPSKRNNPYANSGIVVSVGEKDWRSFAKAGALAALRFQESVERAAFEAGGGALVAPAQRLTDLVDGRSSASLPSCSYLPGLRPAPLSEVLPAFVHQALKTGFRAFGKAMPGYLTEEALVVATESRTSSPVRIPRDPQTLAHPALENLYPCGEGAGYAGGIMSAAMDGQSVAAAVVGQLA